MPRRHYPPANPARLYQQYPLEAGGGGEGGGGSVDLADYYRKSEADDYFVIAPASTPAAGDILYNIDGTDDGWTLLPIGTDGYVLKVATGFPSWAVNNADDADTLDGQHGTYYLDLANHTGRLPSDENLPLLPDGN
ncbi:MAG: hypothetical protein GWN18_07615, partial [Thermoplasmata archaeon]|nr:hypothetical protein [Thermoplasmata archaeon]NIS19833.1 hypothetical protein [Thermoplasmata archaeon]NIT77032.1 hypothetical protein [Thermoplasmata archaeon]NIU48942.1 hypothetical protein [Thermoplasmata archaeon]NIV78605.1 hypothetical protein [Thermoplasmata archaeon]